MGDYKLTTEETGSLCLSLAHLFHAGIGVSDACMLLKEDEPSEELRYILGAMAQKADEGQDLASILRQVGCFPHYACALLEVGQTVGKTETTLRSLARFYTQRSRMTRQLRDALLYPAALFMVLLAVVVVLLVWVLPIFNDVYAQLGSRLTGLAGGLLVLGTFLRKAMPGLCVTLILGLALGLIPGLRRKALSLWQRRLGDRGVFRGIHNARFLQALSLAMESGMTAQDSVLLAQSLCETTAQAFRIRCNACLKDLDRGCSLSKALGNNQFLCPTDCRLLEAGQRSGSGELVMAEIVARISEESEEDLERQIGKVEPAMVAVACVLIGVVLLSVMLPLMHIMQTIG